MRSKGREFSACKIYGEASRAQDQGHMPHFYSWLRRLIGDVFIMTGSGGGVGWGFSQRAQYSLLVSACVALTVSFL